MEKNYALYEQNVFKNGLFTDRKGATQLHALFCNDINVLLSYSNRQATLKPQHPPMCVSYKIGGIRQKMTKPLALAP